VAGFEVYEEVHVAIGRSFAAGEGPEGAQATDAMLIGCVEPPTALAPELCPPAGRVGFARNWWSQGSAHQALLPRSAQIAASPRTLA
jgi:hypothetical protein